MTLAEYTSISSVDDLVTQVSSQLEQPGSCNAAVSMMLQFGVPVRLLLPPSLLPCSESRSFPPLASLSRPLHHYIYRSQSGSISPLCCATC